jgi:membrane-associated phospholipid phosphatase
VRYGVLADIHGNLHALRAVLGELDRAGVDRYLIAGDLVGYGPNPNECVEVVPGLDAICVAGNHDLIAIERLSDEHSAPLARQSLRWTRGVLTDDARAFLASLPLRARAPGGIVIAHGWLDDGAASSTHADQRRPSASSRSAPIDPGARGASGIRLSAASAATCIIPGTVLHRPRASDGLAAAPLAGVAAGLFCSLYLVGVGTPLGRSLDGGAVLDLEGLPDDVLDGLVVAVSPLTVALAVAGMIWLAIRFGRPTDGIRAAALVAASALLAGELEVVLGRVDVVGAEDARELGPSFYPSGHAAVAMSLALAAVLIAPPRSRLAVTLAGAVWSSLFGFAVYAGGSHHPSDVLGGFLLALAVASLAAVGRPALNDAAPRDRRFPTTPIAAVVGTMAVASLLLELARRLSIPLGLVQPRLLLAAAVLSAAAFVIVAVFASLLEPR